MELFYDLDEFINDMIEQTLMNNVLRNSMETYNEELFTKDENLKMNAVVKKMPENQRPTSRSLPEYWITIP